VHYDSKMQLPPTPTARVCAVVVTYNPKPSFLENVAALSEQVDRIVVVDNGSSRETQVHLAGLESRLGCKVIRNRQNLGIAAALNIGVRYATEAGFDWVATFDQDSRVSDGFISLMLETYRRAPHPEKIAIVAPAYVDRETGAPCKAARASDGSLLSAWSSGSMMPVSAIRSVGAFDESLFIDRVDTDFCLRARRKGALILQSSAVLFHSLGRTTYHRLFGRNFEMTNHSAGRRYYITRNRLRLLGRYWMDRQWARRECWEILTENIAVLLVEDHKWQKLRAIIRGAVDALRGKTGKRVEL
jgi:rhamnosyltransferase